MAEAPQDFVPLINDFLEETAHPFETYRLALELNRVRDWSLAFGGKPTHPIESKEGLLGYRSASVHQGHQWTESPTLVRIQPA